jgi:hypothetical protein
MEGRAAPGGAMKESGILPLRLRSGLRLVEAELSRGALNDTKTLGAGLSPAEGSVKPTAGFTFDKVIYT